MKKQLFLSALLVLLSVGAATKCATKTDPATCCVKQPLPTVTGYYENYSPVLLKYFY